MERSWVWIGASEESLSWAKGVPAPRDADGLEIPLDVDALYDKNGNRVAVSRFSYVRGKSNGWTFNILFEYPDVPHYPQDYHLSKPDSWERLEEDAAKTSCGYFGRSGLCVGCPALAISKMCNVAKSEDIVRRAKALAGVVE